ncbi:MAG: methyl-accepting chemotaxis protein [Chthoniobacterales bacterium]|nr:methyl-accepting chemotaxis protein [Chthoniobacterales bacterium]
MEQAPSNPNLRVLTPEDEAAIQQISEVCRRAASGDFEARILHLKASPVWAEIASSINLLLDILDAYVRESATVMSYCSQGEFHRPLLLRGLHGAYRKAAKIINQAALLMKKNRDDLDAVARMARQNAEAVTAVAAACEELNATTSEIASRADSSSKQSEEALQQTQKAIESVRNLHNAFSEIVQISGLIRSISEKTNLLALNATIEASRAGQAGIRFAVVANEVKALATNTANATENIKNQVETMRQSLDAVEGMIRSLANLVSSLTNASGMIAQTIREQTNATLEISKRMSEISHNTSIISDRISS